MTITLTYDETVASLQRAVETMGADYTMERGSCTYFTLSEEPACIVGHVMYDAGYRMNDITGKAVAKPNVSKIGNLIDNGVVRVDSWQTRRLLAVAQAQQDDSVPWGEALERALAAVERGI